MLVINYTGYCADGEGEVIPFNPVTYEYEFNFLVPHLQEPFSFVRQYSNISKVSGVTSGERCNYIYNETEIPPNSTARNSIWELYATDNTINRASVCRNGEKGDYCQCQAGLKCMNSAQVRIAANAEPLNLDYESMAPNQCLFYFDCPNNPKAKCRQNRGTNCDDKSDKCLKKSSCLLGAEFSSLDQSRFNACEDDFNCASGYCMNISTPLVRVEIQRQLTELGLTDIQIPNKMCMPVSTCRPACTERGEQVPTNGFCCAGLVSSNVNGNNYCYSLLEDLEEIPNQIDMNVNDNDCTIVMNELNDNNQNIYRGSCNILGIYDAQTCGSKGGTWTNGNAFIPIKEKVYKFEKYFAGIEWLWGDADSDGTTADWHKNNSKAQKIGELLRDRISEADEALYDALVAIEEQRKEQEKNSGVGGQTVSGIFSMKLLSSISLAQSLQSRMKANAMMEILGFDVNRVNELAKLAFTSENESVPDWIETHIEQNNNYTSLGRYRTLALYPKKNNVHNLGNYKETSRKNNNYENNCENVYEANYNCVKEGWRVKNIIPEKDTNSKPIEILVDPIYPKKMLPSVEDPTSFFQPLHSSPSFFANYLKNLIISPSIGSAGPIDVTPKNPMPPETMDEYNNKPEVLNAVLFNGFKTYADEVVQSSECINSKRFKNNIMVDNDELAIRIKSYDPEKTDDDIRKTLLQTNTDIKRELAHALIAEEIQYHMAKFHASRWENGEAKVQYDEFNKAAQINKMILMAGYLARYYAASEEALNLKSQCLLKKANEIEQAYKDSGSEEGNMEKQAYADSDQFLSQVANSSTCGSGGSGGGSQNGKKPLEGNDSKLNEIRAVVAPMLNNVGNNLKESGLELNLTKSGSSLGANKTKGTSAADGANGKLSGSGAGGIDSSKSKIDAIFNAKKKAQNKLLKNLGIKKDDNPFGPTHALVQEMNKAFPGNKTIADRLAKNGISLSGGATTGAIRDQEKKEKDNPLLSIKKGNDDLTNSSEKVNSGYTGGYDRGYTGNSKGGMSKDQENLLDTVNSNKNKIKNKEPDSIWEQITNSYLLKGVPRLFEKGK